MKISQAFSLTLLTVSFAGPARLSADSGDAAPGRVRLEFTREVLNIEVLGSQLRAEPSEGLQLCAESSGDRRFGQIPFRLPGEDPLSTEHFLSFMVTFGGNPLPTLRIDLNRDRLIACDETVPLVQNPTDPGRAFRTLVPGASETSPRSRYRLNLPVVTGAPEGDFFQVDLVDVPVARKPLDGAVSLWVLFDGNHDGLYDHKFGDGILVDRSGLGRLKTDPYAGDFFSYSLPIKVAGESWRVIEIDPQGRHLTLAPMLPAETEKFRPLGPGDTSETIDCMDAGGSSIRFGGATGRYQLLHFWLSQCSACEREIKALAPVLKRIAPDRLATVGISLDATRLNYAEFVKTHEPGWPQCFVGAMFWDNPVAVRFGVTGPSDLVLLDPEGKVVTRAHGVDELKPTLDQLFLQAPVR